MEVKKSPKADLQNKKGIFNLLGLVVSLLLMVYVFSWSQKELSYEEIATEEVIVEEEIVEITRQEEQKPEPPKIEVQTVTDLLEIVKDEIKIDDTSNLFDNEFDEDSQIEIPDIEEEEEVLDEDVPIMNAEKMPSFQGGDINNFAAWVKRKVKYPAIAEENGISGRVTVKCVIERDGTLSSIEILSSPDQSLSDECIRVFKSSPKWEAGENRGKPVRVTVITPVSFGFSQ
ncbi:MAG: energy transducer TonB [Rikenellaceae bacterium]